MVNLGLRRGVAHSLLEGMVGAVRFGNTIVMDPLRFICDQDGFFTRAMAREMGYDDKAVGAMLRAGVWHRFRRGYYTFRDSWTSLNDVARHRVRSRAVMHSLGPAVALSHVSGVLAHGMFQWGSSLDRVHVTRLDGGASRIEGDVVHHRGSWVEEDLVEVDGLLVIRAERCAIEHGSMISSEASLVTLDSLLHRELCDEQALRRQFARMGSWPGVQHLHIPVRLADVGAESPGESRGRWLFWTAGLPAPQSQFEVHDAAGRLVGTCDWGWPHHKCLGEFDGKIKYGRLLKPSQEPGDVVFAEKQREDLLREITGFGMIRLVWSDYDRPRVTTDRIARRLRSTS